MKETKEEIRTPRSIEANGNNKSFVSIEKNSVEKIVLLLPPFGMCGSNYLRNLVLKAEICDIPKNRLLRKEDWFIHWSNHLEDYVASLGGQWKKLSGDNLLQEIDATKAEILSRFGQALAEMATQGNRKRTILKTPSTKNLQNLRSVFPGAKVIFLVRDGRDACFSRLASGFDQRQEESFRFWSTRVRHMMRFMKKLQECEADALPIWIRFEDAVLEPNQQLERIAKYLDVEFDATKHISTNEMPVFGSSEFGHNPDGTFTKTTVDRPANFNPIGRWRIWPRATRELFNEIAGNELIELGYELDASWCEAPDK